MLALLGLTIVPSVLVLAVGGELIRSVTQLWFSQPVDDVLRSATRNRRRLLPRARRRRRPTHAQRIARNDSRRGRGCRAISKRCETAIAPEVTQGRLGLVEVYRVAGGGGAAARSSPWNRPLVPRGHARALADRLADRVASGSAETQALEPLDGGGELVRAGAIVRDRVDQPAGRRRHRERSAVRRARARMPRRITEAYENYSQLRVAAAAARRASTCRCS